MKAGSLRTPGPNKPREPGSRPLLPGGQGGNRNGNRGMPRLQRASFGRTAVAAPDAPRLDSAPGGSLHLAGRGKLPFVRRVALDRAEVQVTRRLEPVLH